MEGTKKITKLSRTVVAFVKKRRNCWMVGRLRFRIGKKIGTQRDLRDTNGDRQLRKKAKTIEN